MVAGVAASCSSVHGAGCGGDLATARLQLGTGSAAGTSDKGTSPCADLAMPALAVVGGTAD